MLSDFKTYPVHAFGKVEGKNFCIMWDLLDLEQFRVECFGTIAWLSRHKEENDSDKNGNREEINEKLDVLEVLLEEWAVLRKIEAQAELAFDELNNTGALRNKLTLKLLEKLHVDI